MQLGGIIKNSFIDYPGKISSVLFLNGCNFRCPYCHNHELALGCPENRIQLDDAIGFLEGRRGFIDGVVVSGGEPTLNSELKALCTKLKEMGYPIKLDTNGSRPGVLKELMDDQLIDYVAMDIKTHPDNYTPLIKNETFDASRLFASISVIMESGLPHEFRTTCMRSLINPEFIGSIAKLINGADLFALQNVTTKDVLDPEYFENNSNASFSAQEMEQFRQIAAPWVAKCIVR